MSWDKFLVVNWCYTNKIDLTWLGDTSCRDVCLLSVIMELDGTWFKYIWQTQQECLFPEIMTCSINIIHRPCWERFNLRTIFFLPNYPCQHYLHTKVPLMDERLVLVKVLNVNSNGVQLGWVVTLGRSVMMNTSFCCWVFQMFFWRSALSHIFLSYSRAGQISLQLISPTQQLTPKQSRQINSSTGERKIKYFWFWGEMPLKRYFSTL